MVRRGRAISYAPNAKDKGRRFQMRTWRVAGINFDHLHMGDLLREGDEHPCHETIAICHVETDRMEAARKALSIPDDRVFTDVDRCIRSAKPDLIILCPAP